MIFLRKLHLYLGFTLVPFLVVTAVTGAHILLTGSYQTLKWHSWFRWGGLVLALGLLVLAVTGAILYLNMRINQWRRRAQKSATKG